MAASSINRCPHIALVSSGRERSDSAASDLLESPPPKLLSSLGSNSRKPSPFHSDINDLHGMREGSPSYFPIEAVFDAESEEPRDRTIGCKATLVHGAQRHSFIADPLKPVLFASACPTFYTAGFYTRDCENQVQLDLIIPLTKPKSSKLSPYKKSGTQGLNPGIMQGNDIDVSLEAKSIY